MLKKSAQELLEALLEIDPKKRITPERALRDPYLNQNYNDVMQGFLSMFEDKLRKSRHLHEKLMCIISAICAPNLKLMIFDRMCNPGQPARENEFPSVEHNKLLFFTQLFYYIDKNGNGFLSKEEVSSCTFLAHG